MKRCVHVLPLVVAFLAPASASGEPMTLDRCLHEAVTHHPALRSADAAIRVREADADSTRGRLLPVFKAKFNATGWDSDHALKVDVSPVAALLKDFELLLSDETKAALAGLKSRGIQLPVRDAFTYQTAIVVGQPLTQLYPILFGWEAQKDLAQASRIDRETVRHQVETETARAWYGLAAATRLRATAEAALATVGAVEQQVEALLKADVVEQNALLKVRVQKADIQRKVFQAEKGMRLAAALLNAQMGRALDAPVEPEGDGVLAVAPDDGTDGDGDAVTRRPELRAARQRIKAAKAATHVAIGEAIPQVTAFATYENNQGFGELIRENQFYGGVLLEWTFWDWGTSWYKVRAARARAEEAEAAVAAAEDRVRLDLESRRLDLEEARKSREVTRTQVEQARENLRVEKLRFDVSETTVTDLLQAQTLALQSENEDIVAELKVREARLALRVGRGEDLIDDGEGK
jgi:outer membrane protein TolC